MANNPYVNKVVYGNSTLIDLSQDTATQADVAQGKYFHLPTGERVQGTGANDFIITVSYNSTTQKWEPDCTWADYQAAVTAGKTFVMKASPQNISLSADLLAAGTVAMAYSVSDSRTTGECIYYRYVFQSTGVVAVSSSTYIIPSGTLSIAQNATGIDVSAYASVDVAVPLPPDGNNLAYGYTDPTLPLVGVAQVGYAEI